MDANPLFSHAYRCKNWVAWIDNLQSTAGIKRVNNEDAKDICGMRKSLDRCIAKSLLRWYDHIGHMADRLVKKMWYYSWRGRPYKRWTDL